MKQRRVSITLPEELLEKSDKIAKEKLYGKDNVPMAQVKYNLKIGDVPVRGFSSFLKDPLERRITLTLSDGKKISIVFDKNGADAFELVNTDGKVLDSNIYSVKETNQSRVYREWDAMLNYHQSGKRPGNLAGLEDAIADLVITDELGKKAKEKK